MVVNILIGLLIISIVVIAHEFGHFIMAKANGVEVIEFAIGFGPKFIKIQGKETLFSVGILPFGGYCMMLGMGEMENGELQDEEDDETDENKKLLQKEYDSNRSFANKTVWQRFSILVAGPVFNFVLAFVLAVVIIGSIGYDPFTVDSVADNSPATTAGLQVGDRIVEINGESIAFEREYAFYQYYNADKVMNITYERDGQKYTTNLTPERRLTQKYMVGVSISSDAKISEVTDDSPAKKAGMKVNDIVKSIDGQTVSAGSDLSKIIAETKDKEVEVVVDRGGSELTLKVTPSFTDYTSYYTGFASYGARVKASPLETIRYSFSEVGYWIKSVVKSVGMMFTGQVTVNDLSGPVGTVSAIGTVVEASKSDGAFYVFLNLVNFGIMFTANLGVLNLLPIPGLDGGKLIFILIEAVRGKPIKKEREGIVNLIGMALLVLLSIYVLFKDIVGLF